MGEGFQPCFDIYCDLGKFCMKLFDYTSNTGLLDYENFLFNIATQISQQTFLAALDEISSIKSKLFSSLIYCGTVAYRHRQSGLSHSHQFFLTKVQDILLQKRTANMPTLPDYPEDS